VLLGNFSSLCEMNSSGRSGSSMWISNNKRYLLKSLLPEETKLLGRILPGYYQYLSMNKNSFLTRFIGWYRIDKGGQTAAIDFVVMMNIFYSPKPIHVQYDLKGSTIARSTKIDKPDPSVAMKDNDFGGQQIFLGAERKPPIMDQIQKDASFLNYQSICDYSLLIGIHYLDRLDATPTASPKNSDASLKEPPQLVEEEIKNYCVVTVDESINIKKETLLDDDIQGTFRRDFGGMLGVDKGKNCLYFIGIIDLLTEFGFKKNMEASLKGLIYDKTKISALQPDLYFSRFVNYVSGVIE